jgi:hypothetical protein
MKTLNTILLSLSMLITTAQNWALSSSEWRYNFSTLSGQGFIEVTVAGDTTINNIVCRKLNKKLFQQNAFTGNTQSYNIGEEYTYEDNGLVYIRYLGLFDTLYNFNALPGTKWDVPGTTPVENICNTTATITVIDTETISINGNNVKSLIVDYAYKNSGTFLLRDTIIERVGSIRQYISPWDICLSTVDANEGGELRCYNDVEIGEYKHNFYSNCTVVIGVESENKNAISLYPNPTMNSFIIKDETSSVNKICVLDIFGKLLSEKHLETIIDISDFPDAVYFVETYNKQNKLLGRSKIIKY